MKLGLPFLCCLKLVTSHYLEINTTQGPVRGYKSPEGIYEFYGIPYATAPTGTHKFRAPLPPPKWKDVFEAVEQRIACPQYEKFVLRFAPNGVKMREDCLTVNLFIPDTKKKNLPVLVIFFGGAYQFGNGEKVPTKSLVKSEKIISITFNHRVGAHGFLCLGTKDIPGNAGMKDQVALLRWVKRNIVYFGGNPNDVTLSGCSSGGSEVDLHLVSKMSRGLFHKVIGESGASLSPFTIQVDPIHVSKVYAEHLNFTSDDRNALEIFYKSIPHSVLSSMDIQTNRPESNVLFAPCIESDIGEEMFLDEDPLHVLLNKSNVKVPLLYGISEMDGSQRIDSFEKWKDMMNKNFSQFLPQNLKFINNDEMYNVSSVIKSVYFGDHLISGENILAYIEYFTDVLFSYSLKKSTELQIESGNDQVYLHQYTYARAVETVIPYVNVRGASHCALLHAVIDQPDGNDIPDDDINMIETLRELWLNFIVTGEPVPKGSKYPAWPPATKHFSPYMNLNKNMELRVSKRPKKIILWDEIYRKYYKSPRPPII